MNIVAVPSIRLPCRHHQKRTSRRTRKIETNVFQEDPTAERDVQDSSVDTSIQCSQSHNLVWIDEVRNLQAENRQLQGQLQMKNANIVLVKEQNKNLEN